MSPEAVRFDNTYAAMPERFFARIAPEPVSAPKIIRVNRELAELLGFDPELLASEEGAQIVAGNRMLDGAEPIATVYAGHQFGSWNPRLGDGRAILLGEVLARDGRRFDVQLKGSGRTPYSRGGDGRAPLGPALREYVVSEAMAALGIPTTRSLAVASTGDPVMRDRVLPGGILVRVAQSHLRIGTFEYFASRNDVEGLKLLLEHVLQRHDPDVADAPQPALALLERVARRQARLIAEWQLVGFIHGVINTDNMLISGETIDYGPCAFMDAYDPATVFSSIDVGGRYAYANQPRIAQWNLVRLAQALLPVIGDDESAIDAAQTIIDEFPAHWSAAYQEGMAAKLGLAELGADDQEFVEDLLKTAHAAKADWTRMFRQLANLVDPDPAEEAQFGPFDESFAPWIERWRKRLNAESPEDRLSDAERAKLMRDVNPAFIPRNHQVEAALTAAEQGDYAKFHRLVDVLRDPYVYDEDAAEFAVPPKPEERVCQTFCGT